MTSPASPPATFLQLLHALRAEHEREVGALLAQVQKLHVQSHICHGQPVGSSDASAGREGAQGLAACVQSLGAAKFRSPNGRYKAPMPSGVIQLSREATSPATPSTPRQSKGAERNVCVGGVMAPLTSVVPQPSKETTAVADRAPPACLGEDALTTSYILGAAGPCSSIGHSISSFGDVECEPVPANPTDRRRRREAIKDCQGGSSPESSQLERRLRGSSSKLDETHLWPLWEAHFTSKSKSSGGQLEARLREAMIKRAMGPLISRKSKVLDVASSALTTRFPMSPTSRFKMAWDLAAPFMLLYDVVMIPIQVFAFRQTLSRQILELVMLVYWALDMLVSFNTAYYDEHGEVIVNYRKIVRKYLTTWFVPDLAITGFDISITAMSWAIDEGSSTSQNVGIARLGKFLRVARIVRILRLGRIAKLRELIYGIQVYIDSEAVAIAWGLCGNIFTLLILNHINACCWYWVGSSLNEEYTWLKTPYQGDQLFEDVDNWDQYFASLHWSLALFTPAGMNVQPQNLQERIYAVVSLLPGLVIFASFVSTVTAGMTRLRQIQNESLEQSFQLRKFLRENSISTDLMARITRYVDITMKSHKKSIPKDAVVRLKWLSGPLHMELMWELSAPTLRTHSFFVRYASCSVAAMRQVCCHSIKVHSVSRRDTVFSSFEHAWCLYNIKCGSLVYRPARGLKFTPRVTLDKGDWFVEQVLWIRWVHHGTMKAKTESDLMTVDSEKFREVTAAHPDVLVLSSEYAAAYARGMHGKDSCDVPQRIFDRHTQVQRTGSGFWDHIGTQSSDGDSGSDSLFTSDSEKAFDEEQERCASEAGAPSSQG